MPTESSRDAPASTNADLARTLIESFPELVFLVSREGRMLEWNRHLEQVTGYPAEEVAGMSATAFFPEEQRADITAAMEQAFAEGSARVEATVLTRAGERIPHLFTGRSAELDGTPVLCGFAIDISQRREVEQALTENKRFLETLVRNLPGVVYRCRNDPDWTLYFVTEACTELVGYTPDEMIGPASPTLGELIHDEDEDRLWDTVQEALRDNTPFQVTYRLGHRDGSFRWVWEQGRGVFAADGQLAGVEGFITDITPHKRAQDELQQLANRLHATLESITDAFFTLDLEWRFTYLNQEAERVLEQSRTALLGSTLWDALPDLRGSKPEKEFRRALDEQLSVRFEHFRRRSGRWHEYHLYPSAEGLTVYVRDITREKNDREQIEFLALYDPVTHLPNRRLLEDRLDRALATSRRNGSRGALLFIDLDDFKSVNDSLGHDQGDVLLQQVAGRLRQCLRSSDTIARFGGDEFAIVLEDVTRDDTHAETDVQRVADKIHEALVEPYQLSDRLWHTTASIGIASFTGENETSQDLLKRADLAMYQAKQAGRNTSRLFEPSMEAAVATRMQLQAELRKALDEDAIEVHYQPQFDGAGTLIGAEALARWTHADRGPISPAEFIPLAEHTGLIVPLGRKVIETACRQLARWRTHAPTPDFTVSVNVSARQFHETHFIDDVLAAVERTGIDPRYLRLELTESMLLQDMEASMQTMSALRAHGIRFSLDDFGTGYSSLAYLKSLPLDRLKIDQAFVRDMATDANDAAIVRAIIAIADSLGLGIVAEGVETEAARALLAEYGCEVYQGYLFARPMPATDLAQWFPDRE